MVWVSHEYSLADWLSGKSSMASVTLIYLFPDCCTGGVKLTQHYNSHGQRNGEFYQNIPQHATLLSIPHQAFTEILQRNGFSQQKPGLDKF